MATAIIHAGICGFTTKVEAIARPDGEVELRISSDCPSVQELAGPLQRVDPMREISYRGELPAVLEAARAGLPHPACVVPAGILKAVEVAAGLALAAAASIELSTADDALCRVPLGRECTPPKEEQTQ